MPNTTRLESFGHYGADQFNLVGGAMKWASISGKIVIGRRPDSFALESTGGYSNLSAWLDPAYGNFTIGMAFWWPGTAQSDLIRFFKDSYTGEVPQFYLGFDFTGKLIAYNAAGAVLFQTTPCLVPNAWNYVEIKRSGTTGTIRCAESATATGTLPGSDLYGFYVNVGSNSGNKIADFYLRNYASFMGDVAVNAYFMKTAVQEEWTPKTGSSNVAMIDEQAPDEDVTYNSADQVEKTDLFQLDPAIGLDPTLDVPALQLSVRMEHVNTAAINGQPVIRSGTESGALEAAGASFGLPVEYTYLCQPTEANPDGNPWTVGSVIDAVYGYRSKAPA